MTATVLEAIAQSAAWANEHRNTDRLRQAMHRHGCLVYAAGGYGRQVAAALRDEGYPVKGFVDSAAQPGQDVLGLSCRLPDAILPAEAHDAVLVMAINNFRTPSDEVLAWARQLGFAEIVTMPELPDVIAPRLGNYWQASRQHLDDHRDAIARAERLLTDQRSRDILRQLVTYRISGRTEDHPPVDRDRQYFPADLPLARADLAVIDCGAFPGDLAQTAQKAGLHLARWFAFEPDPGNFRALSEFAAANSDLVGEAILFPCGVGDRTGSIRFATGNADASRAISGGGNEAGGNEAGGDEVGGDGAQVLPIVRIADVLRLERLDLVKLDIEGFEAAALDGLAPLLAQHRPRLAMAIYHKPSDLWELPLKVDAMQPGGRYAIRQHGYNGYDTVLYVDWD